MKISIEKESKARVWIVFRDVKTGCYLVGKRSKIQNNPNKWNFVGGKVDIKESSLDAAIRECEEETKIKISKTDLHLVLQANSTFYFECFKKVVPRKTEETTSFKWVLPKDIKTLDKHWSIKTYFSELKKQTGS
jgi:8-oxo-dGTP pyrophosphatase MutT (NUDIX family)